MRSAQMGLNKVVSLWRQLASDGARGAMRLLWNVARLELSALLGREYVRRRVHGNRMDLRVRDRGVSRALAIFGSREVLETEIFRREVGEGMTVVDLGANVGYYTLLAASIVGPRGKVYAIEPVPENFEQLRRHVRLNGYEPIVETFELAISDTVGTTRMYLGLASNLHTLVDVDDEPAGAAKPTIEVQTTTLDRFLAAKRPVEFLRMDIEGGEVLVFDGMQELLKRSKRPQILFEVHPIGSIDPDPRYTPRLERLLAAGYHCRYAISSFHPTALGRYRSLGYEPVKVATSGQAIFEGIRDEHVLAIAARRPKITRALLLAPEPRAGRA